MSSRTYVSALERGLMQPTITKVDDLAANLRGHPLTLLAFSDCKKATEAELEALLGRAAAEARTMLAR